MMAGSRLAGTSVFAIQRADGSGYSGASYLSGSMAFVVATVAVLGLTLDLDYPRAGLVRVNQTTMVELQQSLKK